MRLGRVARVAASVGVVSAVLLGTLSTEVPTLGASPVALRDADLVHGAARDAPAARPEIAASATRMVFRLPELDGVDYTPNARNIAIRSATQGPLLLFLPATGSVPRDYQDFLNTASNVGYHVLALDYWNLGRSVTQTCGSDPNCYGQMQANRFDGSHPSRYSAIAPADSIRARLTHALRTLTIRDPQGGWARYLTADRIRWNRIVLAGHSQGGGESAFIGHHHRVQGVLMFASPVTSDGTVVASWLSTRGATPLSKYYGFDAANDMYFPRIQGSWAALKMGGTQPVAQISDKLPIGGSHRIVTDLPLGTPHDAHSRMIDDAGPRTASGAPLFESVWRWMLLSVTRT